MDSSETNPQNVMAARGIWRWHSAEFKARVIELARQPGISIAAVALANGLNANMLRRWVHEAAAGSGSPTAVVSSVAPTFNSFVQLAPPAAAHPMNDAQPLVPVNAGPQPMDVTIEIRRGNFTVSAKLPLDGRSAAWLREVLG